MRPGWRIRLAIAAVAVACLSGCSTVGAPHPSVSVTSPGASASSVPPTPVDGVVNVDESDNGATVSVHVGDLVVATLHSTYWRFAAPTGVLEQQEDAETTPDPKGSCLPGVGCGTVRITALAASAGAGTLSASRTTCGEAMGCGPGQGNWTVQVVVR